MPIPVIDERVKYVGATALRGLNAKTLRELKDILVIQVDEKPVAVVIPYSIYMRMQEAIWPSSLLPALEKFLSGDSNGEPASNLKGAIDHVIDRMHGDDSFTVTAIGTDMTPRGGKFARVDDGQPPVVDDLDEAAIRQTKPWVEKVDEGQREYARKAIENCERLQGSTLEAHGEGLTGDLIQKTIDDLPHKEKPNVSTFADAAEGPRCHHCGKLNPSTLCSDCFLAGHRGENCLVCAGGGK